MYYGHQLHMSTEETMNMRWGLFVDMMACAAIDNGGAEQKTKKTQEELIFGTR